MDIPSLLGIYVLVGIVVTAATPSGPTRWLAPALWPLLLPGLLTNPGDRFATAPAPEAPNHRIADALDRLQDAVERWHPAAAVSLEGTEEALLALDGRRAVLTAWLEQPQNRPVDPVHEAARDAHAERTEHLRTLRELKARLEADLEASLARVEELTTRIQLAHFQGQSLVDVAAQLQALTRHVSGVVDANAEVDAL